MKIFGIRDSALGYGVLSQVDRTTAKFKTSRLSEQAVGIVVDVIERFTPLNVVDENEGHFDAKVLPSALPMLNAKLREAGFGDNVLGENFFGEIDDADYFEPLSFTNKLTESCVDPKNLIDRFQRMFEACYGKSFDVLCTEVYARTDGVDVSGAPLPLVRAIVKPQARIDFGKSIKTMSIVPGLFQMHESSDGSITVAYAPPSLEVMRQRLKHRASVQESTGLHARATFILAHDMSDGMRYAMRQTLSEDFKLDDVIVDERMVSFVCPVMESSNDDYWARSVCMYLKPWSPTMSEFTHVSARKSA